MNEFGKGVGRADVLGALSASPNIVEDTIKAGAAGTAFYYAAQKALTYPLRSSIVRGHPEVWH